MFKGRGCNRLKEFSEIPNSENDLPRLPYTPVIRDKSIRFVITSPPPPLGTIPSLTCKTPLNLPDESVPAHSYSSWTSLMKQQPIPTQTQQQVIEGRRCNPGSIYTVLPVVIEDLENFYITFFDDLKAYEEIQAKIRNTLASCPPLPHHPVVGSYAIAIGPKDGEGDYFRAQVISVEGESVHVRYIDFGNSGIVDLKELKVMPEDLFNYHACATRVTLIRVPRLLGALPLSIRSYLDDCIDQLFTILVLPSTEPSTIECTQSKAGEVLNDTILELLESSQQSE